MARYQKLVRDRIPALIEASGVVPQVRTLGAKAYKEALRTKLIEEARECAAAEGRKALLDELADLQEVIGAICEVEGIGARDVAAARRLKRRTRGGFKKRLFLLSVKKK